ncbi:MAG TPA: hypothetical protein VLF62_02835 [Candidatus Saccharimonadales bacterium]|nr:hypothetical protein [Candidatus Saccharimonadales bacterium]
MSRVSPLRRAQDIALEVAAYRPDYNQRHGMIAYNLAEYPHESDLDPRSVRRYNVARIAWHALEYSHAVIQQTDRHVRPAGRVAAVTRRTLAMTALAGSPLRPKFDPVLDDCCLGAELKFVHALEHHRLKKWSPPSHEASLVLHDVAGEPAAYQKAVGYPYAYVWRNSLVQTRAGLKQLTAGSIIRSVYNGGSEGMEPMHEKFAGAGLVGITGCVADDVEFKRFGLEVIPDRIRNACLLDASEPGAYESLRRHVAEARVLDSAAFAGHVSALLGDIKTHHAA